MAEPVPFDICGPLPEGTLVLEASAGTGKTFTIAALVCRFVAETDLPLSALLVVTFSKSATKELRARVRERLASAAAVLAGKVAPEDAVSRLLLDCDEATRHERRTRIDAALAAFDMATIATTHEFCQHMHRQLGSLADQEPHSVFVEDLRELTREVTSDVYLAMFAERPQAPFSLSEATASAIEAVTFPLAPICPGQEGHPSQDRVDLVLGVRTEVERRRRARGIVTFDDAMHRLDEALAHPQFGHLAQQRLSQRYRVVLIDEFQDTDPLQWRIVEQAFIGHSTVVLIGDPKQAIYAFRGADVYSYLDAVRRSDQVATLDKNWRSDPALVAALNGLWHNAALGEPDIPTRPVVAALPGARLHVADPWQPLRLRIPHTFAAKAGDIASVRKAVDADLAVDIAELLQSGATLTMGGRTRALAAGDIAVIVRSNQRGAQIQAALHGYGINAVVSTAANVLAPAPGAGKEGLSRAASDWHDLLSAVCDPRAASVRQAALTKLVGWDFARLATATDMDLAALSEQFRHWATTLQRDGIAGLAEAIRIDTGLEERLLKHVGGERYLTDLRHVAEITHEAARRLRLAPAALPAWLRTKAAESGGDRLDSRTRRLESDSDAVNIMTVHASKGLEYPVIYLPDVADRWQPDKDKGAPLRFHERANDGSSTLVLDVGGLGGPGRVAHRDRAWFEEAGDDLRLLYVASTRAQCMVTLWWAASYANTQSSALHRILAHDRTHMSVPELSYPLTSPAVEWLSSVAAVQEFEPRIAVALPTKEQATQELRERAFTRVIDQQWRRTSFSALTAGAHEGHVEVAASITDEPTGDVDIDAVTPTTPESKSELSPLNAFAGGTQFGSLVHAILEHTAFTSSDPRPELIEAASHWLERYAIDEITTPDVVADALLPVVNTPLGPLADERRLADIARTDRVPELSFDLPLSPRPQEAGTLGDIAGLLCTHLCADDPLAGYADHLAAADPHITSAALTGFLTGSIDALLRVGNPAAPRYLVVDYKTNRFAPANQDLFVSHYSPHAMAHEMITSHYVLQSLLYCVATHRFLRLRQPGYQPQQHLGGVLYLFVRGMAGPQSLSASAGYGVFSWQPPVALITDLSDLLTHAPGGDR